MQSGMSRRVPLGHPLLLLALLCFGIDLAQAVYRAGRASVLGPSNEDEELRSVILFHRHGDKIPPHVLPNSLNKDFWASRPQALTSLGKKELKLLGLHARERYMGGKPFSLIPANSSSQYVSAYSTDTQRTRASAESFLCGLLQPNAEAGFCSSSQGVPLYVFPLDRDIILRGYIERLCPRNGQLVEQRKQSDEYQRKNTENQPYFRRIEQITGLEPVDLSNINVVYQNLVSEESHGLPWIEGFREDPELVEKIKELFGYHLSVSRGARRSDAERRRLVGGNMLAQVISRFEVAAGRPVSIHVEPQGSPLVGGEEDEKRMKLTEFSVHEGGIVALLSALGIFDMRPVPFAASVAFELYLNRATKEPKIQVFYNNGVSRDVFRGAASLPKCSSTKCPLQEFIDIYSQYLPQDFAAECAVQGGSAASVD